MGHGNVTFQPRQAEVIVARGHNKCRIEIGSDQLFFTIMARCAPFYHTLSVQQLTVARRLFVKEKPVSNGDPLQAWNDCIEINTLDMQRVSMHLRDAHGRRLRQGG